MHGREKPENDSISVIPWPSHVQAEEGHFSLWKGTVVHLEEDSEIQRTVGFLNERLSKVSGYTLKTKPMDLTETEDAPGHRTQDGGILVSGSKAAGLSSDLATEPERSTDFRPCSSYFLRRYSPVKKAEGSVRDVGSLRDRGLRPRFSYRGIRIWTAACITSTSTS